jgi:hypothetical protein
MSVVKGRRGREVELSLFCGNEADIVKKYMFKKGNMPS